MVSFSIAFQQNCVYFLGAGRIKVGAKEFVCWIAERTAPAAALTEMVFNHEVTEEKALPFAHGYLHDNAAGLTYDQTPSTATGYTGMRLQGH